MAIYQLIKHSISQVLRPRDCGILRNGFLLVVFFGLVCQILYDQHAITIVALFPQWVLLGSIWYLWRPAVARHDLEAARTSLLLLIVPVLAFLALLVAWIGAKANIMAICGVVPISDAGSYYISAETFLRETFLDASAQRRPLNTVLTALWLYLSGDHFKVLLLLQALGFSAAAFLASAVVATLHGFRSGLLFFAFLLVFAEPYLPTTLSETNGIIFGTLALVGFLLGLYRRSALAYCLGTLLLAFALAIRPSAQFVLPCVILAGFAIYPIGRIKRSLILVALVAAILIPSALSITLNRTMSEGGGAFNANFSYVIYGLVSGGKGWEQYGKDFPKTLDDLSEAQRSHVILQASKQHLRAHPGDLVRGLVESQALGPLQSFSQISRLAFLGAAGDPLRLIPASAIMAISLCFAGILACLLLSKRGTLAAPSIMRTFFSWFMLGYLISIPFFYKDGGLRIHAAVLPIISYILVRALRPLDATRSAVLSSSDANRLVAATTVFTALLLGLSAWISLAHPSSRGFSPIPPMANFGANKMPFMFKPGWPQCDLAKFAPALGDDRPRWFSGAIPDDNYRSAGIKAISGLGNLYFGFDTNTRIWKIIHTSGSVGLLNEVEIASGNNHGFGDTLYRDFYSAKSVQAVK